MAGLDLQLYNDPVLLWDKILEELNEETLLILPSQLARNQFLQRQGDKAIWSGNILTVLDIRKKIKDIMDNESQILLNAEMHAYVENLLENEQLPESLRNLKDMPGAIDILTFHLAYIDTWADLAYKPTNETEAGIELIRKTIDNNGYMSSVTFSSTTARHAKDLRLSYKKIIFAPVGNLDPMLSGLFKGLAENHYTSAYLLVDPSQADSLLKQSRLEDYNCHTNFTDSSHKKESKIAAHHQAETILDTVAAWIEEGASKSQIGIITAKDDDLWNQLEQQAAMRGLPISIRTSTTTKTSALGTALLDLVEHWQGRSFTDQTVIKGSEVFPETKWHEIISELDAAPNLQERVSILYRAGQNILQRTDPFILHKQIDQEWLDGLHYFRLNQKLQVGDLVIILSSIKSQPRLRGALDGVLVISYEEAPPFIFERVIYASLDSETYPPRVRRSAFISEELLEAVPELEETDHKPEFSAALLIATEERAFIRLSHSPSGQEMGHSPYWPTEDLPLPPLKQARSRQLQHKARHKTDLPEIIDLIPQTYRNQLPQGALGGPRTTYSVTELENFQSCPLGWFVRYALGVRSQTSSQAELGSLSHKILEETINLDEEIRAAQIKEMIQNNQGLFPESTLSVLEQRLKALSNIYSPPAWPLSIKSVEGYFEEAGLIPGRPAYKIKGRADRVDENEDGDILIIDYKSGRRPNRNHKTEFQSSLYPLLAEKKYGQKPLGLIYVSIRFNDHDGLLNGPIPQISNQHTRHDWQKESEKVVSTINDLITKIEDGDFLEIGKNCPDWCGHKSISQTLDYK